MLQLPAGNWYFCGGMDYAVELARLRTLTSGTTPRALRTFQGQWWDEALVRDWWPVGPLTRCLLFVIPGGYPPACGWLDTPLAPGQQMADEYLYCVPWDPDDTRNDIEFRTYHDAAWGTDSANGQPIVAVQYPVTLKPSGEDKLRAMLRRAVDLWNRYGISTELEVGNEINMLGYGFPAHPVYTFSGPGMMPGAYAYLWHEVCAIASEPDFRVFDTPSGRISLLGPGLAQYGGSGEWMGLQMVTWPHEWSLRNPYHPDGGIVPQRLGFPDVRYTWEWLDAYYRLGPRLDGGPMAYPGTFGHSERPGTGIVDRLDGLAFHCYQHADTGVDADEGEWIDWALSWRRRANWYLSHAGTAAHGPDGAVYPAYYRTMPCFATEASFLGLPTAEDVVRAYRWIVESYYNTYGPETVQGRLRRIYLHPDAENQTDALCAGEPPALTIVGAYQRALSFVNE